MKLCSVTALLLLLLTLSAEAEVISLPATLSDLEQSEFHDLEAQYPGKGYLYNYRAPNVSATIYLYDNQAEAIPASVEDELFLNELKKSRTEFEWVSEQRQYANLTVQDFGNFETLGDYRCRSMVMAYTAGQDILLTWTCIMPYDNKILKLRYTLLPKDTPRQRQLKDEFSTALGDYLSQRLSG